MINSGSGRNHYYKGRTAIIALVAASSSSAVYAQVEDDIPADLEALVDAAQSPESAISAARAQIAENDLSGAASTLERALLADRNSDDVRALYATVLCRLDDPKGAELEIDLIKGRDISPEFVSELRANCGLTPGALSDSGGQKTNSSLSGKFSVGLAYDSDTVGANNFQFRSFPPFPPIPAVPTIGRFKDDALAVTSHFDLNARSPAGDGWIYGGISADARFEAFGTNIGNGNIDYQSGELRFGYGNRSENSEFEIGPVVRHTRIFNEPYVSEIGAQARLSFLKDGDNEIILKAEAVHEDFSIFGTGNANLAPVIPGFSKLRDGWNFDLSLAGLNRKGDDGYIYYGAGVEYKEADLRGFWAGRVFAAAKIPIDTGGSYAKLSAVYRYVDLEARPALPIALPRKDHRFYARGALGTPLGDGGLYAEVGASFSARYSSQSSNLHDYDSVGVDAKLIWRF